MPGEPAEAKGPAGYFPKETKKTGPGLPEPVQPICIRCTSRWEGLIHTQMSVLVDSVVVLLAENNRIDDTAVTLFDVEQTALGQKPEWFSSHVH